MPVLWLCGATAHDAKSIRRIKVQESSHSMKTVKIDEFAQKISRDLNSPEPDARAVLERAVETIRKELQRGNGIELGNFIAVHIRQGDPIATATQGGGPVGLPSPRMMQIDLDESLRHALGASGLHQIM